VMDKKNYIQNFPYDEYDNETDNTSWTRQPAIISGELNTATQKNYTVNAPLKQGWYYVEAVTKDKDGEEVKDLQYFQIFNPDEVALAYPQYQWNYTLQNSVRQNDTAKLLVGTSAKNVYLIQTLNRRKPEKDFTTVYTYTQLNNEVKPLTVITSYNDRLGLGMSYSYIKNNRFYTGSAAFYLIDSTKSLNVQYATYRNKTEPGSKENWTIKVSGNNNEKVAAELLTAMYDASLDQFAPQSWSVPLLQNNDVRYFYSGWQDGNVFNRSNSQTNYFSGNEYYVYSKNYNVLATNMNQLLYNSLKSFGMSSGGYFNYAPGASQNIMIRGLTSIPANAADAPNVRIGYGTAKKKELTGAADTTTDTDGDGVPDYRDKEILTPKAWFPVDANGVGTAAEPACCKELRDRLPKKNTESGDEGEIQIRKNFNETAFFFPQLYADANGHYSFSFTMPESLTKWKWLSLAHSTDAVFGQQAQEIISQKTLMVQPNLPRFLREGDDIIFAVKISNLGNETLSGNASIQLFNALTNEPVSGWISGNASIAAFSVAAEQSTSVNFPVKIPKGFTAPVSIRIVADGGKYSDGEERTLPVLSNRTLVTEALPLFVKGDTTKHFVFEKLLNNQSTTLQTQSLTVEYTANPVWNAVQSLPYLMEFPHECAEQTFNRFYANALAAYIVAKYPRIQSVFEKWKTQDTAALQSNLQKNEELKQILLQETPWVLQAENEAQQKKNIALLFDMAKMSAEATGALRKLEQMQMSSGGFPWFKGGWEDRYITQYILAGIGRLIKLHAVSDASLQTLNSIAGKATNYLDGALEQDYLELKKNIKDISKTSPSFIQIQYLYARSYFTGKAYKGDAFKFYYNQSKKYWQDQSVYFRAMTATTFYRNGDKDLAVNQLLKSILENAVENDSVGMYWKDMQNGGWYWYEAPIEKHASVMETVNEIAQANKDTRLVQALNGMQQWLIRQKQTTNWKTTKATADACYALLLSNSGAALKEERTVKIQLGNTLLVTPKGEAGSGYFKTTIPAEKVVPKMGTIT
ncbi:MAG: alpha-2-macroglobulin, partial [Chitinophagaceae bacterium]|nr:alpha-2-macroglobulin [Chitinophagaceae bacterium]